jgi:sugar lactone lactonase YvrE
VRDRRIYVAESGAARVTVYDRDGDLLQTFGERGRNAGQLSEPTDVALDAHGDVWVLNGGNNRIEHFAADGRVLGSIAVEGWSGDRMKEDYLAIDARGVLYVGDWDLGAVRRFQPDGRALDTIGSKLREPSGLAIENDRLLVAGRGDDVVHVLPLAH